MKFINGFWLPNSERAGWVRKLPVVDGRAMYQRRMLEAGISNCRRFRTAVDGGAHVGLWTCRLAYAFREVLAFEPVPELSECLIRNTTHQSNVLIRTVALGDSTGEVQMHGNACKSVGWNTRGFGVDERRARMERLDGYGITDLDFLKLDVEGGECAALRGAEKTLRRCKPVVVIEEKHDPEMRASAYLESLGMRRVFRKKNDHLFIWR